MNNFASVIINKCALPPHAVPERGGVERGNEEFHPLWVGDELPNSCYCNSGFDFLFTYKRKSGDYYIHINLNTENLDLGVAGRDGLSNTTNRCAIALGSNLGDSLNTLKKSLQALDHIVGISVSSISSWYRTEPVGNASPQPDYLNGCAILQVQQNPQELLVLLQAIEVRFGRIRTERWGARTLDLDLILYEDLILDTPELQIPHLRMRDRAFVLVPLAEIAPEMIDPVTGKTIAQLLTIVDRSGISYSTTG